MTTPSDFPDRCCECDCPNLPIAIPLTWTVNISGVSECPEKPWLPCEVINDTYTLGPTCPPDQECNWLWFGPLNDQQYCGDAQFHVGAGGTPDGALSIGFLVLGMNLDWRCGWHKVIPNYSGGPVTFTSADLYELYAYEPWCNWNGATIQVTPG